MQRRGGAVEKLTLEFKLPLEHLLDQLRPVLQRSHEVARHSSRGRASALPTSRIAFCQAFKRSAGSWLRFFARWRAARPRLPAFFCTRFGTRQAYGSPSLSRQSVGSRSIRSTLDHFAGRGTGRTLPVLAETARDRYIRPGGHPSGRNKY
jgi:hypothetical protein